MLVKALRKGYIGNRRVYEDEVFDIDESEFSKNWMTKEVTGGKPAKAPLTTKEKKPAPKGKGLI